MTLASQFKATKSAITHRLLADVDVTAFSSRSPPDKVTESNLSNKFYTLFSKYAFQAENEETIDEISRYRVNLKIYHNTFQA